MDGQVIAIKKLDQSDSDELKEKDFLVEIGIMAHISHPNTTPLLGFCLEGGLYLVYKFYPHGSLASILHGIMILSYFYKYFHEQLHYGFPLTFSCFQVPG